MARPRKYINFDDLPLFAEDAELSVAVVGTDPVKRAMWMASLPALESRGFPRKTPGFGRYKYAVLAFYDRFYELTDANGQKPEQKDGPWTVGRRKPTFIRPGIDKR